jgi:streptogramin lyase
LAVSAQNDLYIAQGGIRRVDGVSGLISTIAQIADPISQGGQIALDTSGHLFIALSYSIGRVDIASGKMTTVAGGYGGALGDGGPATSAGMAPSAVAVDQSGNLYIADYWNYRVRRVDAATGIITTIAGNGQSGSVYDGTTGKATQINVGVPTSIAVSPAGQPY